MKIRKLQLKNIGVFDDEIIEFQPCPTKDKAEIHIFTGQNGSGKTTILQILAGFFDDMEEGGSLASKHIPYLRNSLFKKFRTFEFWDSKYSSRAEAMFSDGDSLMIYGCPTCKSIHLKILNSDYSFDSSLRKVDVFRMLTNSTLQNVELDFAVFAASGYRQIENERVEAIKEPKEFNPLSQALGFLKNYNKSDELTINQLITNNISKSAIEKGRNEAKSKKFANVLKSIEQAISEITGWKVEFDLETEPTNLITKVNGEVLDFAVLPDGLRSLISWIADLLGRVDLLKWQDDLPIFEKNLILLLDEIEVHLHPEWQRKVLPVVQKLFKNSQIFVSTHSPFVVNSVDDAWVYKLKLDAQGKAKVESVTKSEDGNSYSYVLEEIFDIKEEFGIGVQKDLEIFKELRNKILASNNGNAKLEKDIKILGRKLAKQSEELNTIIQFEIRQINRRKGTKLTI